MVVVVTTYLGNRNIKVQIKCHNGSGKQNDENGKGSILEICHLHFQTAELHTPTDGRIRWRRFKPDGLPIRGLDVL